MKFIKPVRVSTYDDEKSGKILIDYELGGEVIALLSIYTPTSEILFEQEEHLPLELYQQLLEQVNNEVFRHTGGF